MFRFGLFIILVKEQQKLSEKSKLDTCQRPCCRYKNIKNRVSVTLWSRPYYQQIIVAKLLLVSSRLCIFYWILHRTSYSRPLSDVVKRVFSSHVTLWTVGISLSIKISNGNLFVSDECLLRQSVGLLLLTRFFFRAHSIRSNTNSLVI